MIGRKGTSTEKALADVLARRERAEAEAEQATAKLAKVEAETEQKLQIIALSSASPERFQEAKLDAIVALQSAQADDERTRRAFAALSEEADRLATLAATERVEALTLAVETLTSERDAMAERFAGLTARLDATETDLANAQLQVPRAARWTAENKARSEALERQELEVAEWHARHNPTHAERWPSHLGDQIRAQIERLREEADTRNERLRRESAENLAERGLHPVSARETLGIGQPWPQARVR